MPTPTGTQPHPQRSYLIRLRPTHVEAERIKAAVAERCLLGHWSPETDDADWALQWLVTKILEEQGVAVPHVSLATTAKEHSRAKTQRGRKCPTCLRLRHDRSRMRVCPQCRAINKEAQARGGSSHALLS